MLKISGINIGSSLLSIFILIGFIGTSFVLIRLSIIGINYIKVNFSRKEREEKGVKNKESETKGF